MPPRAFPEVIKTGLLSQDDTGTTRGFERRLVAVVTTLVTKAMASAVTLVDHARRTSVGPDDIRIALRHECRKFLDNDESSDGFERDTDVIDATLDTVLGELGYEEGFDGFMNTIADAADAETETDSDSDSDSEDAMTDSGSETGCVCSCEVCTQMLENDVAWNSWTPTDPIAIFLKEKTDAVFL